MSAIWGIIDLNGNSITPRDCSMMEKPFLRKKIDKIQSCCRGSVFLACGLQYVSEEARQECYPYEAEGCCMVADAILDNRSSLQRDFRMVSPLSSRGIDGSILFDCLQQDLPGALDAMLGAYVFALYSEKTNTLTLANDVTGTRSVYYMVEDGRFYFSSLLEPLLEFKKPVRNDSWFFHFFADDSLRFVNEARQTPYEDIFRLEPGELLTFSPDGLTRKGYWDPLAARKELKLPDHEAYAQQVRQVFGSAVRDLIRGDRDVAMLLSGGLDSNAVAAFAAPRLQELGKKLCSFTSVPDADHPRPVERGYYVADERGYVELLQKKHPNLDPEWIGCNHYDYLEGSKKASEILEIPYKTIPNMLWMQEAYERAAGKGCSALLTGQYGNITISAGNYENLFETLLKDFRLSELNRQAKAYGKVYRRGRKWVYGTLLGSFRPQSNVSCAKEDLNPRFYGRDRKLLQEFEGRKHRFPSAMVYLRPYMYDKVALRQVGETELKLSLETGVIPRDPTRDKRLIELVMSLPLEEFCWDGVDRRLVRQDMEGLIPPEILRDIFHRGQQGVGANDRLIQCWPQIKEELRKELKTGHAEDFLNIPYLLDHLDDPDLPQQENIPGIIRMIYCSLCSHYIGIHYDK